MRALGPDSKYMMQWMGVWRPVMNMFDHRNVPTTLALRACKAVLYVSEDYWVATRCDPGEIVERPGRSPNDREWEPLD